MVGFFKYTATSEEKDQRNHFPTESAIKIPLWHLDMRLEVMSYSLLSWVSLSSMWHVKKKEAMHLFVNSDTWGQMCASQLTTPLSACQAHSCTLTTLKLRVSHHGCFMSMGGGTFLFLQAWCSSEACISYASLRLVKKSHICSASYILLLIMSALHKHSCCNSQLCVCACMCVWSWTLLIPNVKRNSSLCVWNNHQHPLPSDPGVVLDLFQCQNAWLAPHERASLSEQPAPDSISLRKQLDAWLEWQLTPSFGLAILLTWTLILLVQASKTWPLWPAFTHRHR